jgi:hypothetical protein
MTNSTEELIKTIEAELSTDFETSIDPKAELYINYYFKFQSLEADKTFIKSYRNNNSI